MNTISLSDPKRQLCITQRGSNKMSSKGLVFTNEKCVGCNKCINACSCLGACISTMPDESGKSRIEVDADRCIACGACFGACEHSAREFRDDTERFFEDLKKAEN